MNWRYVSLWFYVDISSLWCRTKASTACSGHHSIDAFTDDSNWFLFDLSETKKHPIISPRECPDSALPWHWSGIQTVSVVRTINPHRQSVHSYSGYLFYNQEADLMDQTNAITWIGLVIGMIGAISPTIFGLLAIFWLRALRTLSTTTPITSWLISPMTRICDNRLAPKTQMPRSTGHLQAYILDSVRTGRLITIERSTLCGRLHDSTTFFSDVFRWFLAWQCALVSSSHLYRHLLGSCFTSICSVYEVNIDAINAQRNFCTTNFWLFFN